MRQNLDLNVDMTPEELGALIRQAIEFKSHLRATLLRNRNGMNKYKPHQGKKECARRLQQLARAPQ
jgi:hypothetical protein